MAEGESRSLFTELVSAWQPYESLRVPPSESITLWSSGRRTIYLDQNWGAPVPYPAMDRHDGSTNHGHVRLKGNLGAIDRIPEIEGWPELRRFLLTINADTSPLESIGCEKHYFPLEGSGVATVQLGSYVDLAFSVAALNERPLNLLRLAAVLMESLEGCEEWWASVEFALQRLKGFPGAVTPWGLMLRVGNAGRDEAEARKFWRVSLARLDKAISTLPQDFPDAT